MSFEQDQVWRSISGDPGNYYCNASESERQMFKDWIQNLLHERAVIVDFVKADGDFRSMKCTLNELLGAKYTVNENKDKSTKKSNPDVCVVWDVNQGAWRSFRWDRLKKVQFDLG
jgi:hypothetical protein